MHGVVCVVESRGVWPEGGELCYIEEFISRMEEMDGWWEVVMYDAIKESLISENAHAGGLQGT